MGKTKDIEIRFCESCQYLIKPDSFNEIEREQEWTCPKCGRRLWEIYELKYYTDGKVSGTEAGITDHDECDMNHGSLYHLFRIINKGYKLFKKEKKLKEVQDD